MDGLATIYTWTTYIHMRPLHANWHPERGVKLGDYGVLDGKRFDHRGHISDYEVTFQPSSGNVAEQKSFVSRSCRVISVSGGVEADDNARAKLEISFNDAGGVFFNATNCAYSEIDNKQKLGDMILSLGDRWNPKWVIVTDLVSAQSCTIAVSDGADGRLVLTTDATIAVPSIDLANADLKLIVKEQWNIGYKTITATGLVPLIGFCKLRRPFFSAPDLITLGDAADELVNEVDHQVPHSEHEHYVFTQVE